MDVSIDTPFYSTPDCRGNAWHWIAHESIFHVLTRIDTYLP